MFARCVRCKKMWNVSPKQKIGKSGYWCPRCEGRRKAYEDTKKKRDS